MKGLLRDNFYAAYANEKVYFMIMLLVGILGTVINPYEGMFIRNYALICLVGFSFVSLDSLRKDGSCKWEKYKLIVPVTRADIVKSCYIGQMVWIITGMLYMCVPVGLTIMLHGFPFDRSTDLLLILFIGMSVSFLMGAIFFPLFYLCGDERKEASLVISVLSAIAAVAGLVWLLNSLFGPEMTDIQIVLAASAILVCAILMFGLSYLLASVIFSKKEY